MCFLLKFSPIPLFHHDRNFSPDFSIKSQIYNSNRECWRDPAREEAHSLQVLWMHCHTLTLATTAQEFAKRWGNLVILPHLLVFLACLYLYDRLWRWWRRKWKSTDQTKITLRIYPRQIPLRSWYVVWRLCCLTVLWVDRRLLFWQTEIMKIEMKRTEDGIPMEKLDFKK